MGRFFLLVSLLLAGLCGDASAGTLYIGNTGVGTSTTTTGQDTRDIYLCFIPDTQNQTSQDDQVPNRLTCAVADDCTGTNCTKSPYCSGEWQGRTSGLLMRNLAYELTGQYSKIDWTEISGNDPTRSFWPNALAPHPRCDVIISLGDMADINDGVDNAGLNINNIGQAGGQQQWLHVREFWSIINASGIPYLPVRGNHDPANLYRELMETTLNFTSKSFYYAEEPTRDLQYAIKFPTPTGKQFCVIGGNSAVHTYLNADGTELAWVNANVGCGANLPTIVVQHEGVDDDGDLAVSGFLDSVSVADTSGYAFMFAGGHNVPAYSAKSVGTLDGFTRFRFGTDFQECNRHNAGLSSPYGVTPSDGSGDYYTVIRISPERDTVSGYDWSPYWLTTNTDPDGCAPTSSINTSFDFDARFP